VRGKVWHIGGLAHRPGQAAQRHAIGSTMRHSLRSCAPGFCRHHKRPATGAHVVYDASIQHCCKLKFSTTISIFISRNQLRLCEVFPNYMSFWKCELTGSNGCPPKLCFSLRLQHKRHHRPRILPKLRLHSQQWLSVEHAPPFLFAAQTRSHLIS
jgi:hypothetical protein